MVRINSEQNKDTHELLSNNRKRAEDATKLCNSVRKYKTTHTIIIPYDTERSTNIFTLHRPKKNKCYIKHQ